MWKWGQKKIHCLKLTHLEIQQKYAWVNLPLENTGINSRCIQVAPYVNSSFYYKVIVTVSLKIKLLETEFIQNFVKKKKRQKMYKLPSFLSPTSPYISAAISKSFHVPTEIQRPPQKYKSPFSFPFSLVPSVTGSTRWYNFRHADDSVRFLNVTL